MRKYLLLFFLLFPNLVAASKFEEVFDMSANGFSRQATRIMAYMSSGSEFDAEQQQKELDYISVSLIGVEQQFQKNPVYWFVRGLFAKHLASYYQSQGEMFLVDKLIKEKNEHYMKAMRLDKENEPHLSASAYAEMKPGLPEKFKQQAIEAELNLGGSGESDSYYWYLHWSNINELKKQGREKEASDALSRMNKELQASGQKKDYEQLVEKINKELKPKVKPPVTKLKVNDEPSHAAYTEETVGDSYYRYLIIIASLMLGLIVIALVFELWRRKRRER